MRLNTRPHATALLLCLLALAPLLPASLRAQDLPPLDASYIDSDAAAQRIVAIDANDSGQRSVLENTVRREPRNVIVRIQYAQLLLDRGMRARVPRELASAVRFAGEGSDLLRSVHFNAGWMHYRMGEFDVARSHWLQAFQLHGGHPDWVPVAFALALWGQGDRDTALAFFKRAATAQPEQWGSAQAIETSAAALGANERFALLSMLQANAEQP
jgi:tetratricopeptide (TPR) repeat protein